MKKREIELGGHYVAKVSGRIVTVKVVRESPYGGWDAVNTVTGRAVRIKTAGRLHSRADATLKKLWTPWGVAQDVETLAEGILNVGTASHGGIHLDKVRNEMMPESVRNANGWYEEDCEWALVAMVFPAAFSEKDAIAARHRVLNDYPEAFEALTGEKPTVESSRVLAERAFEAATLDAFIVRCAYGDWHSAVPEGMVGVIARRESDKKEIGLLLCSEEYKRSSPFGFVVENPDNHASWSAEVAS